MGTSQICRHTGSSDDSSSTTSMWHRQSYPKSRFAPGQAQAPYARVDHLPLQRVARSSNTCRSNANKRPVTHATCAIKPPCLMVIKDQRSTMQGGRRVSIAFGYVHCYAPPGFYTTPRLPGLCAKLQRLLYVAKLTAHDSALYLQCSPQLSWKLSRKEPNNGCSRRNSPYTPCKTRGPVLWRRSLHSV